MATRRNYPCLPCPHCATEDDDNDIVFNEYGDDEGQAITVACARCGATGPVVRGPLIGRCTAAQHALAARLWNARGGAPAEIAQNPNAARGLSRPRAHIRIRKLKRAKPA